VAAVQAHEFDLFGMSASSDERLDQIAPMIMSVRKASRNRDITVMVGGRLFVERPELVAKVGADAMATDARQAVLGAEGAVRLLAARLLCGLPKKGQCGFDGDLFIYPGSCRTKVRT
jgi:methylmalonyl-CoA mutase cobalamin-binding subunit